MTCQGHIDVEKILCSDEYVSDWSELDARLRKIEQFLRARYREEWDSFEADEK